MSGEASWYGRPRIASLALGASDLPRPALRESADRKARPPTAGQAAAAAAQHQRRANRRDSTDGKYQADEARLQGGDGDQVIGQDKRDEWEGDIPLPKWGDGGTYEYLFFVGCYFALEGLIETLFLDNCNEFADLVRSGDLDFFLLQPIDEHEVVPVLVAAGAGVAGVLLALAPKRLDLRRRLLQVVVGYQRKIEAIEAEPAAGSAGADGRLRRVGLDG